MPKKPAQPHRLCTARVPVRDEAGNVIELRPCKGWAIKGGTVCRAHGGNAPRVKAAAARRVAEAQAQQAAAQTYLRQTGQQPDNPVEALKQLAARFHAVEQDLFARIATEPAQMSTLLPGWGAVVKLEAELLERLVRYAPQRAQLEEDKGRLIVDLFRAATASLPADLRANVQSAFAQALRLSHEGLPANQIAARLADQEPEVSAAHVAEVMKILEQTGPPSLPAHQDDEPLEGVATPVADAEAAQADQATPEPPEPPEPPTAPPVRPATLDEPMRLEQEIWSGTRARRP